jgi:capsular exopolysaccharide synthesis family protein
LSTDRLANEDRLDESSGEIDLAAYWAAFKRRWKLVAACLLLALGAGLVQSFLETPLYRATLTIKVEPEKFSPVEMGLTPAYYMPWTPAEFLPTQLALLRSREIAERVVQRLDLTSGEGAGRKRAALGSASREKASREETMRAAREVQANVGLNVMKETSIVELSYVSPSPKRAADVANAVADAYIEWNYESRSREMSQASKFLQTQIEQLKSEVEERERKLTEFGLSKDIYTMNPSESAPLSKIDALNKDLSSALADRVMKEAKYSELMAAPAETIADTLSPSVVQLRNEQAKLEHDYEQKLNIYKPDWPAMKQLKLQVLRGKQHLDEIINETVSKAREAARNEFLAAQRREQSLKDVLKGQRVEAAQLNSSTVEFANLRVELSTRRALLDTLMKRQSETEISSRMSSVRQENIRIVDRAVPPPVPFSPSYHRNVSQALSVGLVLGIALLVLLEYMDRSLKSPTQVEQYLKLPSLGVIPAVGMSGRAYGYGSRRYGYGQVYGYVQRLASKRGEPAAPPEVAKIELLPNLQPRSLITEAYRAFRTSLLLSRAGGVQTIVVSSAFPGEGKTATALNLAAVLGQLNKKVLLIDGDLHKRRIHEVLKGSNRVGLVSVLAENVPPERAIQPTGTAGISVLPAGPLSPNPSGLLSSEAMTLLLAHARKNYDYVVIDSPPIQPVSDGLILGSLSDGVVLCVHGGKTAREQVARVRDKLRQAKVEVLGVLINNLRASEAGAGSYGYGYGYAYGYGYGAPEEAEKKAASA